MRYKQDYKTLKIADVEVGGDIHRVVLNGVALPQAIKTAYDARQFFMNEMDAFRKLLLSYPYGHEDMCVDYVFPSAVDGIDHAYVIMECMGYPYFSGSNTVATTAALYEYGLLKLQDNRQQSAIQLEAPSGRIESTITVRDDKIDSIAVNGGTSYVIAQDRKVQTESYGEIPYSLVWSGDYFVIVEIEALGLDISQDAVPAMKKAGKEIIDAIRRHFDVKHNKYEDIPPPGFIHFTGALQKTGSGVFTGDGATFGYPNTLWRCPTGTGTAARMALLHANHHISSGDVFRSISPYGNMFTGTIERESKEGSYKAIEVAIHAKPYVLSTLDIHLNFDNPLLDEYSDVFRIL